MYSDEKMFKEKYLKYKNKYLKLVEQQGSGPSAFNNKDGEYLFFFYKSNIIGNLYLSYLELHGKLELKVKSKTDAISVRNVLVSSIINEIDVGAWIKNNDTVWHKIPGGTIHKINETAKTINKHLSKTASTINKNVSSLYNYLKPKQAIGGSIQAIGGSSPAIGGSSPAIGGSIQAIGGSIQAIGGSKQAVFNFDVNDIQSFVKQSGIEQYDRAIYIIIEKGYPIVIDLYKLIDNTYVKSSQ